MENPPFQLKNIYTPAFVEGYAALVQQIHPFFPAETFLQKVFDETWPSLELKERMRHISHCLRATLPDNYRDAADVLVRTVEHLIDKEGEKMTFEYMFIPDFVEKFGVDDPDHALPALETITRWTSAEFAVRPFLLRYPKRMYAQMLAWAGHESFCVRRLASEGIRPRLPWGAGVPVLKKDPSPVLEILHLLKNDPAETVRRSVANNLNDISKDHPDIVLGIAGEWKGDNPETDWIVRHACRGLLRDGHPKALALFSFEYGLPAVKMTNLQCASSVKIGDRLDFSFSVKNEGDKTVNVRLEYSIIYLTVTGKSSRKIFRIKEFSMKSGQAEDISKYQRFQDFTTRKHYPGTHRLAILVNGKERESVDFEVIA